MTVDERSEQTGVGEPEPHRSGDPVNPWARGGVMSTFDERPSRPASPARASSSAVADADVAGLIDIDRAALFAGSIGDEPAAGSPVERSEPPQRSIPTRWMIAAAVGAVALAATIAIARTDPPPAEEDLDRATGADRQVALPLPAGPVDDEPAIGSIDTVVMPTEPVDTTVGAITWTRTDGDSRSLPARVTTVGSGGLMGDDSSSKHWLSRDGGGTWTRLTQTSVTRTVGGVDWIVRHTAGESTLWRDDGRSGVRPVEIDPGIAIGEIEGVALRVEPLADPFPLAVSDRVYLPVALRAEFPWHDLLGLHSTRAFRLEIDVGGQAVRVASGDFHEIDVERLEVSEVGPNRYEIRRPDGEGLGSFGAPPDGMSLADVVSGRSLTLWMQWNGDRFVLAAPPWEADDRVDLAATEAVILARVVSPDRDATLWRTIDGESWSEVELPVEPLDRASVTIDQLEGEVIVTAFTERGVVSLATVDGAAWTELAPVPGVNRRDRADFGWIAPPTRSEPQIRVSADGLEWELVDLRTMLGLEYSRWDVQISATAIGSDIFVIADQGDARTLLIGSVSTG